MAEEMQKPVAFSMMLVSPEARGLDHGRTEVGRDFLSTSKLCILCLEYIKVEVINIM